MKRQDWKPALQAEFVTSVIEAELSNKKSDVCRQHPRAAAIPLPDAIKIPKLQNIYL